MSAHTPGPWTADLDSDHGDYVIWGPQQDDAFIANVGTAPEADRVIAFDTSKANGNLIAAAPDLLEACREAIAVPARRPVEAILVPIESAIAKAEGR